MIRTESKARARALQLLYAWETTGRPVGALLPGLGRLTGPQPAVLDGAEHLAQSVVERQQELDRVCLDASEHWRLERMGVIERNILRMGIYELMTAEVPPKVAIDEALFLAHRFAGGGAARFINGILDRVARMLHRL